MSGSFIARGARTHPAWSAPLPHGATAPGSMAPGTCAIAHIGGAALTALDLESAPAHGDELRQDRHGVEARGFFQRMRALAIHIESTLAQRGVAARLIRGVV